MIRETRVYVLVSASLALFSAACTKPQATKVPIEARPKLEFFVMSQCPYGVQVMNAIAPVAEKLGDNLDFQLNFIGSMTGDTPTSMHGENEVKGDIVQLCAAQIAPDRYLKMITCQNNNPTEVHTNWEGCAGQVGIDAGKLRACLEGERGKQLVAASFDEAKKRQANGSPTIFLNGKPYQGGRRSVDFTRAVCREFTGEKPAGCNIPPPPPVNGVVINDQRCRDCIGSEQIEAKLKTVIDEVQLRKVDYASDEGKKLYGELRGQDETLRLPAVLLDRSIEADGDAKEVLGRYLHPVGEYLSVGVGATFDPTAEICDNMVDDDGNGKVDCDDPACKGTMDCRPEKVKTLDLFVMSQCPYGALALIAMKEIADTLQKDVTLNVHYIGGVKDGQLTSMHGPFEVDEDVRELCAIKHYPKNHKFLDYLACRSKNRGNVDWKLCTGSNGISAAVIQKCFDTEGKRLLKEDFAVAQALQIGASPTFLANNRHMFNANDAGTIKTNFCQYNSRVAACAKTLSETNSAPGGTQAAAR
jgi:Gamma interferon inducible lysosomal thiol reductase (GILT)